MVALVEHMIVATKYGLFVYESTLLVAKKDQKEETHMSVKYKLSVLPEEAVIDLVEVGDSNTVLACCQTGAYVILTRHASNGVM